MAADAEETEPLSGVAVAAAGVATSTLDILVSPVSDLVPSVAIEAPFGGTPVLTLADVLVPSVFCCGG